VGPDRLECWWELAGPASLLDKITKAIAKSERVVILDCPDPRPDGLDAALERHLGREIALELIRADLFELDQTDSVAHLLGEAAGVPVAEIAQVADFASHPSLLDKVILVDGIDRSQTMRWGLFLRSLAGEKVEGSVVGPVVIVMLPRGLNAPQRKTLIGSAFSCSTFGRVDRHDTIAYLARLGVRPGTDLVSRIAHSVCVDVAAWSRPMLEVMAAWNLDDQIDPSVPLCRIAERVRLPYPCWENGLVDLWEDEPVAHPVAALGYGLADHVQRRIWSAQAAVVLPFADRIRRGLIGRHRAVLEQRVSAERPYVHMRNQRESTLVDPTQLELLAISDVLSDVLTKPELDLLHVTRLARNYGAHMKPMPPQMVRKLADHYEANRDVLECDIPGWDWPRAGQVMTLMVGPSGAGKSTWASTQGVDVVSSDLVSTKMASGGVSPAGHSAGMQLQVRTVASRVMSEGRDVILDGRHLKAEQRKRQALLAPPDINVRYVIIDRPLAEKQKSAGSAAEKGVLELDHAQFAGTLDAMLAGDALSNVIVQDERR
jgi:predicted kinase